MPNLNESLLSDLPTFTGYDYEIHVSQVDGNDTTGDGDLLTPVASITKALTLVTSQRKTVIIHPGTYTESPSITTQYTTLTGPGLIGGNIVISGTVSTNTGCTISGIKMTNLTVSTPTGQGNVNILNCEVSGTFTKSSNADYTVLRLCDLGAASITGAGLVAIFGGNPNLLTVNNASANVIVKSAVTVAPVLTAGTLSLVDSVVTAAVTNAVTSAASSVISLANCQFLTSNLSGVAPVVLNGFYSIFNCVYDKPSSTLVASSGTGGTTNAIDYFQYINADKFITQGGTSTQVVKGDGSLNSVALGTETTGNYVATIAGTANEITVTGSGSETAAVTISLPANVTISNNLTVTGNLTVSGNTTTINTANLFIEDNIILLNSGETSTPTLNAGIEVERGTSTNVDIRWNESTDKWQITNDGSTYNNIATTADLSAQTTTSITANTETTIASFDKDVANAAEFTVKVEQGSRFLSNKVLVLHNGTTADFTKYGELSIAAAEVVAGSGAVTWTTRTSNFGNTTIRSVAYGNNLWVAAGSFGNIRTSTDAITWTTQTSNFGSNHIRSVAYGNNLWVVGGDFGQLRSSTDAITWTTRTSNFGNSAIYSVTYGNNLWVAVGNFGQLRTSTDGTTWTTQESNFGFGNNINSVAYGNNLWVAAGESGQLRTSTDAVTWTTRTSNFGYEAIRSIAYGNNLWVAGGNVGELRTSTDGTTWTTRTSNFGNTRIMSVAYGNNLWVAAGYDGQIRSSTDAITWTTRTSNFPSNYNGDILSAAYGNNLWVAAGVNGNIRTSAIDTATVEIPLALSADISGSDVRLRATITDAATTNASVKVLKTLVEE